MSFYSTILGIVLYSQADESPFITLNYLFSHACSLNWLVMVFMFMYSIFPLAEVEDLMKNDRLLCAHYAFYVREMRIMAYAQLLESYRSLTLQYMADAFGVTVGFIDQ